jgi:hypothetical protein
MELELGEPGFENWRWIKLDQDKLNVGSVERSDYTTI